MLLAGLIIPGSFWIVVSDLQVARLSGMLCEESSLRCSSPLYTATTSLSQAMEAFGTSDLRRYFHVIHWHAFIPTSITVHMYMSGTWPSKTRVKDQKHGNSASNTTDVDLADLNGGNGSMNLCRNASCLAMTCSCSIGVLLVTVLVRRARSPTVVKGEKKTKTDLLGN